jgi:hypothetical protein
MPVDGLFVLLANFQNADRISSAEICDRYPARRADLIRDFNAHLSDGHSAGEVS